MKALVLHQIKQAPQLEQRPDLEPGREEVVVQLKSASLNRRDYWITQGMYPGIRTPVVMGSDGAGVVTAVGEGVDPSWIGREVIINPGMEWGDQTKAQSAAFHILGMPRDGTFAEQVAIPVSQLHAKPGVLNWDQAAAIPLAGVTAYRAVRTQGQVQAGETVLITGIGGGVATFALQFAVALGAKVWVTSSSPHKIQRAVEYGALGGFDYTQEGWHKTFANVAGAPDLIIDSAAGKGYGDLLSLAAPGARLVHYGATAGPPPKFDLFKVFWKQLTLRGSTMGSPQDFIDMLSLIETHRIQPVIDQVCPLEEGAKALNQMQQSPQFGKYVLSIAD